MSCRLLHLSGRPRPGPGGSNGSNTAHCPSVRSNRLAAGIVATRSPDSWSAPPVCAITATAATASPGTATCSSWAAAASARGSTRCRKRTRRSGPGSASSSDRPVCV